jgi:hypothetical protein
MRLHLRDYTYEIASVRLDAREKTPRGGTEEVLGDNARRRGRGVRRVGAGCGAGERPAADRARAAGGRGADRARAGRGARCSRAALGGARASTVRAHARRLACAAPLGRRGGVWDAGIVDPAGGGGACPPSPPVLSGHVSSLTPYQLDTSRPSSRTNRTRRVPLAGGARAGHARDAAQCALCG